MPHQDRQTDRAALAMFLADPERPVGTLTYHELQGFLFAVAAAPELVPPSEWFVEIFAGAAPAFADDAEADTVLRALTTVYNDINSSVAAGDAVLPADCPFRDDVLANLDADAPISLWARGFLDGHDWLADLWEPYILPEIDNDVGIQLMVLTFFVSPKLAKKYAKELRRRNFREVAEMMREGFPDMLADYARLGRAIDEALREQESTRKKRRPSRSRQKGKSRGGA
jgi:uncharacterized protein